MVKKVVVEVPKEIKELSTRKEKVDALANILVNALKEKKVIKTGEKKNN